MDALSDVLRAVRLTGAFFFDVQALRAVGARKRPQGKQRRREAMFPGSDHLISYHLLMEGSCWATLEGEEPIKLSAGDIIVLPHGDTHVLATDARHAQVRPRCRCTACRRRRSCRRRSQLGSDRRRARALRVRLPRLRLASLQPAAHRAAARHPHRDHASGALGAYFRAALAESKGARMGGQCMLGRISELMFVDVVRRYLESLPADRDELAVGPARSVRGPRVDGAACESVARLDAGGAGAGSGLVALRVRRALRRVRRPSTHAVPHELAHAARHQLPALRATKASLRSPSRVGYDSEAAFSRAFKKSVGSPPSEWRDQYPEPLSGPGSIQ